MADRPDDRQPALPRRNEQPALRAGGAQPPATRTQQQQRPQQQTQHLPAARRNQLPDVILKQASAGFTQLSEANAFMEQINAVAFVLAPVCRIDTIPEFHALAFRVVKIDSNPESGDVYKQSGKLAPAKPALMRIGHAAGVTWDPRFCGRVDDGKDRHYCAFKVFAWVKNLDGSRGTIAASKEVDLRDGNPEIFDPEHTHEGRGKQGVCSRSCGQWDNGDWKVEAGFCRGWSTDRLQGARSHILALAETKAMLRAIRSLGMRHTYTAAELDSKPFVVPVLSFTGRSEDPELDKEGRRLLLERSADATGDVFGTAAAPAPALALQPTPPVGQAELVEDGEPATGDCNCQPVGNLHDESCPAYEEPEIEPGSEG